MQYNSRIKKKLPCRRSQGGFKKKRNCSSRRKEAHFVENQWNRASLRRLLRILESAPGFNRNRDFGFARGVRTIILAAMAHRKLIPLGSLILAVAGIAAEQAANAVV